MCSWLASACVETITWQHVGAKSAWEEEARGYKSAGACRTQMRLGREGSGLADVKG